MAVIGSILAIVATLVAWYFGKKKTKDRSRREDIARMDKEREAIADSDSDSASMSHRDRMRGVREYKKRRTP